MTFKNLLAGLFTLLILHGCASTSSFHADEGAIEETSEKVEVLIDEIILEDEETMDSSKPDTVVDEDDMERMD